MTTEYAFVNSSGTTVLEGTLSPDPAAAASPTFSGTTTVANLVVTGTAGVTGQTTLVNLATTGTTALGNAAGDTLAFYGHAGATQQAVTGALSTVLDAPAKAVLTSIIAALVASGLVTNGTT
jgi:hypothetical protein